MPDSRRTTGWMLNSPQSAAPLTARPLLAVLRWLIIAALGLCATAGAAIETPPAKPASSPIAVPAEKIAKRLFSITIRGPIDRITAKSIIRRLEDAKAAGADAIVFDIDTPGGEVGAVLDITNAIKASPIRTAAWINDTAYSGGALVALACNEIIVNDPANMGDAKPIAAGLGGARAIPQELLNKILPPLIGDVVDSAQRKNRREARWVYDELLVQGIVLDDARLWLVEDIKTNVRYCITQDELRAMFPDEPLDGPGMLAGAGSASSVPLKSPRRMAQQATDPAGPNPLPPGSDTGSGTMVPASPAAKAVSSDATMSLTGTSLRPRFRAEDALKYTIVGKVSDATGPLVFSADQMRFFSFAHNLNADGSLNPIRSNDDLKAYFHTTSLTTLGTSWSEHLVRFLTLPAVRGILIFAFLICVFIEMTHPGLLIPGTFAAAALVALLAPPLLIGMAQWWEIAAIILGLLLIAVEVLLIPGFGIPGILGLLLLFVGLVATFVPGGSGSLPDPTSTSKVAYGLTTVLLSLATAIGGIFLLARYAGTLPILNRMILKNPGEMDPAEESPLVQMTTSADLPLVGDTGIAVSPLRPAGRAEINDRLHDVVAEYGYLPEGSRIRVANVTDFRIGVVPDTGEPRRDNADDSLEANG